MIGKTDFDLFPPEVSRHIVEIDRKVLEEGKVVALEDTKPTAGVMRTFHMVKVPLRNRAGEIVRLCGIARDITDRVRLEEKPARLHDAAVKLLICRDEQEVCDRAVEAAEGILNFQICSKGHLREGQGHSAALP